MFNGPEGRTPLLPSQREALAFSPLITPPPGYPGVAALQNPEAAKLLAQMQAPAFPAEMDLQVGDLPWAAFKNRRRPG